MRESNWRNAQMQASNLISLGDVVAVDLDYTPDRKHLTVALIDVDGLRATLWCVVDDGKINVRTLRAYIKASGTRPADPPECRSRSMPASDTPSQRSAR